MLCSHLQPQVLQPRNNSAFLTSHKLFNPQQDNLASARSEYGNMDDFDEEGVQSKPKKKLTMEEQQTNYVLAISDIVQEVIKLHEQGKPINLEGTKSRAAGRYSIAGVPKLQELLAATPEKYKDRMKDIFMAKPIRSASGVAVVAVMSKPHRCPHIAMTGNICVYCFTPDHQFMTIDRGWVDVDQICEKDTIATYNPTTSLLEFQQVQGIVNQYVQDKPMIEVGNESKTFSWGGNSDAFGLNPQPTAMHSTTHAGVVTTQDHDWYGQFTDVTRNENVDIREFEKYKGSDLLQRNKQFHLLALAPNGIGAREERHSVQDVSFMSILGLQTASQSTSFLHLYAAFLLCGSIISCPISTTSQIELAIADTEVNSLISAALDDLNISPTTIISKLQSFTKYTIRNERLTEYLATTIDLHSNTPSSLFPWMYSELNTNELRTFLSTLSLITASQPILPSPLPQTTLSYNANFITTTSIPIRDHLNAICLLAGYTSTISTSHEHLSAQSTPFNQNPLWVITFSNSSPTATFSTSTDVRPFNYTGSIHCASVENGLLFVRRVFRDPITSHITKATTPTILGNCPGGPDSDFEYSTQSYTGYEPTSMRAIRARYDPYKQAKDRLEQLRRLGHGADKVEFILMGGTFLSLPEDYRDYFVRNLHDALSGHRSRTCAEAIQFSEQSNTRCVGLTIETRPDYCQRRHLHEMLGYGCTRLELGVQSTYEDVARDTNRGHTVKAVAEAFKMAKDCGFKVIAHMMPDLPNMGLERDFEQFVEYFENPAFRSDGLKLYPTLVIRGTGLYELYKTGRYQNYPPNTLVDLLAKISALIPPWTRVYRIQRDIPMPLVTSGVEHGNLRQLVLKRMADLGLACRDVRSREVGIKQINTGDSKENKKQLYTDQIELVRRDYTANGGWETFLTYEDVTNDSLIGLLRLRQSTADSFRPETIDVPTSFVRELHVYGSAVPVHNKDPTKFQHQGYGTLLMEEAERIAREEHGSMKLVVIAGVGTRNYYRKLGYELDGPYMSKWI